jgi:hypothetical protein
MSECVASLFLGGAFVRVAMGTLADDPKNIAARAPFCGLEGAPLFRITGSLRQFRSR